MAFDVLVLDLRYALRRLFQNPGFTLTACLSLAIGIGANTAAFSVLYAVLLRPLPVRDANSLALVSTKYAGTQYSMSYPAYRYLRDFASSTDGVIAFRAESMNINAAGRTDRVAGMMVSGNYFLVLGVEPVFGSAIQPEDDEVPGSGGARGLVAMVSHQYWTRRFGRDPRVIGTSLRINGYPCTVVGVAPPAFRGTRVGSLPDVFVPMAFAPRVFDGPNRLARVRDNWLRTIARVKPGITLAHAQTDMTMAFRQFNRESVVPLVTTDEARRRALDAQIVLEPGHAGLLEMEEDVRPALYALMALVSLVLLIACVNVANLMVARAERTHRAIAISIALGATHGRVWLQHLSECAVVGFAGVALGLACALPMRGLLAQLVPRNQAIEVVMDERVLAMCILTAVAITIVLAAMSARHSLRLGVTRALKSEDLRSRLWLRKGLIVGQLALSIVVLVAAALFVRTLGNLRLVDTGFDPEHVLVATTAPGGYSPEQLNRFYSNLLAEITRLPGVISAALAGDAPLDVHTGWTITVRPEPDQPPKQVGASVAFISPDYFRTLGIPILRGRDFEPRDDGKTPVPIMVNENFVRAYIRQDDPIGARITGNGSVVFEIIGVVRDSASIGLRDLDQHMIYVMGGRGVLHVRAAVPPATLASAIQVVVRQLDPDVPVYNVRTVEQQVEGTIARERTFATLSSTFGLLALGLSAIGLYGVMANAVGRRTKELGIRLALGARPAGIVRLVLREAGLLILLGVTVGIPCAWAIAGFIRSLLFGIDPGDWTNVGVAIAVLSIVAAAAAWIPARRAARVDPLIALRSE